MGKNKTAIVTGGSRGIGRAVALKFAEQGYDVCITYISNQDAATNIVKKIESLGSTAIMCQADMTDPKHLGKLTC
ncbi:MAG TPA: SDR family NAD(P)-dependent oxidoreductase [Dehalococcoidia bacterium]|nr:SDR family NAD(P)-dependent oxidoreductase [Dehalococcoidia bacterium]